MEFKIPEILKEQNHFVLRGGPSGKAPVNTSGVISSWTDPKTWFNVEEVQRVYNETPSRFKGIGFIVSREESLHNDQIIGGDIDNCRDPITGKVSAKALALLNSVNTYVSLSPSRCGFRFFCIGKLPNELDSLTWHIEDDLTDEMKNNILESVSDAKRASMTKMISEGKSVWNGVEVYENGRHLTLTNYTCTEYPNDLQSRHEVILEVCNKVIKAKEEEAERIRLEKEAQKLASGDTIPVKGSNGPKGKGKKLPFLSITKVINTAGFKTSGDELVGSHPVFGSTTGTNFKVNEGNNVWAYHHAGDETGGDAWVWVACESGVIGWDDCKKGALDDPKIRQKVKEYVLSKGYLTEEVLFPERKIQRDALKTVQDLKDLAIEDPGLPFEDINVTALAIVKDAYPAEYERIKAHWNRKISTRTLEKLMKAKSGEMKVDSGSLESGYIVIKDGNMDLQVGRLMDDIIKDLNIRVLSNTRSELGIYDEETGTFKVGDFANRFILAETDKRIVESGDENVETLTPAMIHKIEKLIPVRAKSVSGDQFESFPFLICAGNGVVDLRSSSLLPFSEEYLQVERTSTPFENDKPWNVQAPTWEKVLNSTFDEDVEKMEYLQRAMGYCATSETDLDSIFLFYGIGGTGKSTIIDAIRTALSNKKEPGGYVKSLKADLQASKSASGAARDGLAKAKYARLLIVKELDEKNDLSWGTLKEYCSHSSPMEVREIYKGTANVMMRGKIVVDTNHLPVSDTPDRSILRRLKIIPYRHVYETPDTDTFKKLEEETVGILHWLVDGARKYYESGLGNPAFIEEELKSYKTEMDPTLLTDWFENSGYKIVTSVSQIESEHWVKSTDLYEGYVRYCEFLKSTPSGIKVMVRFLINRGACKKITLKDSIERAAYWVNIKKISTL